ncbi:MAG: sugar transferase [Negativicutes bacterium]
MSRFIAILATLALSPVLLAVALIIKWESRGPAIYTQQRVGQFGRLFTIYKFRTMQTGMPDLPSDKVGADDPRFTRSGKCLRRFSIDEFPQLWNIIKGDMVFIGPRPALYNQEQLNEMRHERGIHALKPGITGWAQVNGRDAISLSVKVDFDEYYMKHQDWRLNLRILWMTFFKTAAGDGLYKQNQTETRKADDVKD